MNLIGSRIRKQRNRLRKTATDLANEIGVPISTYREWENGRSIRGELYIKIASALEILVFELLTGDKPTVSELITNVEKIERLLEAIKSSINSYD